MYPESSSFRRALDTLVRDVRYALRLVRQHPGFSAVAAMPTNGKKRTFKSVSGLSMAILSA